MRSRRGFTIVELVVVMVIMAILLTLSVISISSSQANARDNQRNTSAAIVARGLENRYKQGNKTVTAPTSVAAGSYPDINEMKHILGNTVTGWTPATVTGGYTTEALPGTSTTDFIPPGATGFTGFTMPSCSGVCAIVNDTNATMSTKGNTVTIAQYYYEPVDANGRECNTPGTCVRFNLYWRTEVDNTVHVIRSKYQ